MNYKESNVSDYTIQIFDDVFSYNYKSFLYNFCANSRYKIGWEDTVQIENANYKNLHSSWDDNDFERSDFLNNIKKNKKINEFIERHTKKGVIVNLSCSNDVHFSHTHGEYKVLLYYVNMQWKQEWAGETLFFDESGKEVVYTSVFVPGRIIIFDGKIPHAIRPQSSVAPHFRFTLSTFWS